ncbi:MAG: hypothetical protein VKS61_08670 [Candidatus Sericytochromatia bacterium]|nr:hypothetical protein [Candidatus Sericytochromatia bacterium]
MPIYPDDLPPNLVERLFLAIDGIQAAPVVHLVVELAGVPDRAVLAEALGALVAETALLRTRVVEGRLGFRRQVLGGPGEGTLLWREGLPSGPLPGPERLPLQDAPPFQVALQVLGPSRSRLVLSVHHAAGDGRGTVHLADRLAEHYTALQQDRQAPPLPQGQHPRFRDEFRALGGPARWQVVRGLGRALAEVEQARQGLRLATFMDTPLPAHGDLHHAVLRLEGETVQRWRRWARSQGGSLGDWLLAVWLAAACRVWPDEVGRPGRLSLPVDLRPSGTRGLANHTAEVPLHLPALASEPVPLFRTISALSPAARDRQVVLSRLAERAIASLLPPAWFRRALGAHLALPRNATLTGAFSNLGDMDSQLRDLGPVRVTGGWMVGPVASPPGQSTWALTLRGTLTLAVGYHVPGVAPTSIARMLAEMTALMSGPCPEGEARHDDTTSC